MTQDEHTSPQSPTVSSSDTESVSSLPTETYQVLPPGEEEHYDEGNILIAWEGPEFENVSHDTQWYMALAVILLLIIIYAVIINSPLMAITFILIGVVAYIQIQKEPRHLVFSVTSIGILVGDELFSFDDIESFWIFYTPPHTYVLSLAMRNRLLPHVRIPLHGVDPVELREILIEFIPEERQEMGLIDTIERLFHL